MSENLDYPNLENASTQIENWNSIRNESTSVTTIFGNTNSFVITQDAYNQWKGNSPLPQNVHAYLSVSSTNSANLSLWCVDSTTDSLVVDDQTKETYNNNLFEFNCSSDPIDPTTPSSTSVFADITPAEASTEVTAWKSADNRSTWITKQTGADTMVQILVIPFSNLTHLFSNSGAESVIVQFALKEVSDAWQVDLILWYKKSDGTINYSEPEDLIQPVPPYSGYPAADFQLLEYSTPPS